MLAKTRDTGRGRDVFASHSRRFHLRTYGDQIMKTLRLALFLSTALVSTVFAQGAGPSATFATFPAQRQTFTAAGVLAVPQTAAGDAVVICGSATKTVRIKRVELSGTDATAQSATVKAIVRSAANTGGTSTTATNVPRDSNNAAATAVVKAYTAIPTPGAAVGDVRDSILALPDGATLLAGAPLAWDFNPSNLTQEVVLRGVAQCFAVNFPNALSTAGASLRWNIDWTEQ
jgi:hypothetical protein